MCRANLGRVNMRLAYNGKQMYGQLVNEDYVASQQMYLRNQMCASKCVEENFRTQSIEMRYVCL